MKSLKDLLFTGMFLAMASVMFVACGGGEGADAPDASDTPEVVDDAKDTASEASDSADVKEAAGAVEEAADDEEWFPEDELPSASAANNN
jgi:hypothetical protein